MDSPHFPFVSICTFFAATSPFILISLREAVKYQRQESITDLADLFDKDRLQSLENDIDFDIIPSFEFVKYKYFVGVRRSRLMDLLRKNNIHSAKAAFLTDRYRHDFSLISWILCCAPFSALVGFMVYYNLPIILDAALMSKNETVSAGSSNDTWLKIGPVEGVWILGVAAAFSASFLTSLRNLYRAVKNFDLSPGTIVGETVKILLSIVIAPVITIVLVRILGEPLHYLMPSTFADRPSFVVAAIVATCFVTGTMPDVALRKLTRRDYLNNFKHEEENIFRAFKITPLEIIDGIDSDIRVRLEDHHIHSAQNLAAANPLMLFVETPFGVYQIMDWVAQAQLCCSVGRDKLTRLWSYGIRTLFDLERLADRTDEAADLLLIEIGRVILGTSLIPDKVSDPAVTAALVRSSIELRLDDPHVRRLRQIYIAVSFRLGKGSRRFRRDALVGAGATSGPGLGESHSPDQPQPVGVEGSEK